MPAERMGGPMTAGGDLQTPGRASTRSPPPMVPTAKTLASSEAASATPSERRVKNHHLP